MGRRGRWVHQMAERVVKKFSGAVRPRQQDIASFILKDSIFLRACEKYDLHIKHWPIESAVMRPVEVAAAWQLPPLCTAYELAVWLGISIDELDWFADRRLLGRKQYRARLSHYRYRPVSKRFGQVRLIEAPKLRLKAIQRQILTDILDHILPHAAAQGFRRGTSICTFAAPHVNRHVVMRLDLCNFFPTISLAHVQALFRTVGYPESIADLLAGLCTHATPDEIWNDFPASLTTLRETRPRYSNPHLPQGAPTSPALANLCAYRLDCRLAGLAQAAGAVYTRYADDLAFSGGEGFQPKAKRFQLQACAIVGEEGFSVHYRKTRIMQRGVRQQLAGVVVNQHLNVRRNDFDLLKAILTNCLRFGPESQNREGHADFRRHLAGRISFVHMVNPAKGNKLNKIFQQIPW